MTKKFFISALLISLVLAIGIIVYQRLTLLPANEEVEQLKKDVETLEKDNDLLKKVDLQRDSLITNLVKQNDRRLDSVEKVYSENYKKLYREYKFKIDNISNLSIDDNMELFSNLISEKDSL